MTSHAEIMSYLSESRERRVIKMIVLRLDEEELRAELRERLCSEIGDVEILRDRLTRAVFKEVEPGNQTIPWYMWDEARAEFPADVAETILKDPRMTKTRSGAKRGRPSGERR